MSIYVEIAFAILFERRRYSFQGLFTGSDARIAAMSSIFYPSHASAVISALPVIRKGLWNNNLKKLEKIFQHQVLKRGIPKNLKIQIKEYPVIEN